MKRILFLLTLLLAATMAMGQRLTVTGFALDPNDLTASTKRRDDLGGQPCALVRVQLARPGATFEGNVMGDTPYVGGEYLVYMSPGSKMLTVRLEGYQPVRVSFRQYGIAGVEGRATYVLPIALPAGAGGQPADDGQTYLSITVTPAGASLRVDDHLVPLDADGQWLQKLDRGVHRYKAEAPGYEPREQTFTLGTERMNVDVALTPALATLTVTCPTEGADLCVNGQRQGSAPRWTGTLAPGRYVVEARMDGRYPQQQTVGLDARQHLKVALPALVARAGQLDVAYRPVDAEVWIDGRKAGLSPDVFRDVPIGTHRVEIRKAGYQPATEDVTIAEGQTASLSGSLTPTAALTPSAPRAALAASPGAATVAVGPDGRETFTVNGVTFTMVRVGGGTFTMGATPEQESDAPDKEKPAHRVTLSPYAIGETEVTQALWQAVMGANPSHFAGARRPVERVSWDDCQDFVRQLSAMTGRDFRLPTEAEWEYAARGGGRSRGYRYCGSDTIDVVAWHAGNSGASTHDVAQMRPNELGLYDMSGGVMEWCADGYGRYGAGAQTDPRRAAGVTYVRRGGGWLSRARSCRPSYRNDYVPTFRNSDLGLRLALTVALAAAEGGLSASAGGAAASADGQGQRETFMVGGVTFAMVRVGGGTFTMGATPEQGSDVGVGEQPAHRVTLSAYAIGETEVTQALWEAVMGSNPSDYKGADSPVERVSWTDCQLFIGRLSAATGRRFRLPTEAEWEYAARGGSRSRGHRYAGSDTPDDVAWHAGNSGSTTHPVAQKQANELGLYDMSGGVWEWCSDWGGRYGAAAQTDPTGPQSGTYRVARGGGWNTDAPCCRTAFRNDCAPSGRSNSLGLRLALSE